MSNTTRNILIIGAATVVGLIVGVMGFSHLSPWFSLLLLAGVGFYVYKMLAGNQAETQATPAERASALASVAQAGMGTLFIYREGFIGKAMGIDVKLDDSPFVQLKSPRFTMVHVSAGAHTLAAGPRGFAASQNAGTSIPFEIQPGQTVVFRLEIAMGMLKNSVNLVRDEAPAQALARLATITMVIPPRKTLPTN